MATRFYFNEAEAAAVSPTISGAWSHINTLRRRLQKGTPDSSALSTVAVTPDGADHLVSGDSHHRQYVSDPIGAQTISGTVKMNLQCLEANAGNNLFLAYKIFICSQDGTTIKEDVATLTRDTVNEVATSLTNRHIEAVSISTVNTEEGDRIVVEIGLGGTPTAAGGVQGHNGSIRWGGSAAGGDLGENDTDTGTTLRPWIEFSATIVGAAQTVTPSAIASAESFGTQRTNLTVQGTAGGIVTAEAFGSHVLDLADPPQTVSGAGNIASGEVIGTIQQLSRTIPAGSVATAEAHGTPAISRTVIQRLVATLAARQHYGSVGGATTLVVDKIGATGDVMIVGLLLIGVGATAETVNIPGTAGDWTHLGTVTRSTNLRLSVYRRILQAGDPATWSWTWTTPLGREGQAVAYANAPGSGDPISAVATASAASQSTIAATSLTTLDDYEMLVQIGGAVNSVSYTPPAGFGSTFVQQPSDNLWAADRRQVTAGATESISGSISVATNHVVMLLGIRNRSAGIASAEAVGAPAAALSLHPNGIAPAEAFGAVSVTTAGGGAQSIAPVAIASAEAVGAAMLRLIVAASGIPTAEAFGAAILRLSVTPAGIASAEAFGQALLRLYLSPAGIATLEVIGAHALVQGAATISPTGIMSLQAFGIPALLGGQPLLPPGGRAGSRRFTRLPRIAASIFPALLFTAYSAGARRGAYPAMSRVTRWRST